MAHVTGNGPEYGVLESRNIKEVVFGNQRFDTWYGNSAYFQNLGDSLLGIDPAQASRRRIVSNVASGFWIDCLWVCDSCFKYCTDEESMRVHRSVCSMATAFPAVGKLVYADTKAAYIIKKVRGFRHPLFCQNMALFGKLFLLDKSVFYSVQAFDFYVVYGHNSEQKYRPMGFFSKEINSWEPDNNLACICVFPPFQRLQLGNLLIEFSYKLAQLTPGQALSGPEFPLSPFGQIVYLRYWSRRLAFVIYNDFFMRKKKQLNLSDLALATGFRKDDVLMALEYMGVLCVPDCATVVLSKSKLLEWCDKNNIDPTILSGCFDPDSVLL